MPARELRPLDTHNMRYKLKEIDIPHDIIRSGLTPQWVLSQMETHHEDGWDVCASSVATDERGRARGLWIFYRRKGPLM